MSKATSPSSRAVRSDPANVLRGTWLSDPRSVDLPKGHWVSPGFIDLQVNGGWGSDFTADPSSMWPVGEKLTAHGVTSFLPTIVSAPYGVCAEAIELVRAGPPDGYLGARVLGLHLEGPWISPEWAGAHERDHLALPDADIATSWVESGSVAMVTIAPELEGADEVARILAAGGVTVAMGHTGADYATARAALRGDWTMATHLYNQMAPFHHRAPGTVGAVLEMRAPASLIADGVHSSPAAVSLAWEILGPDRLMLVTDAMAATGLGEGEFYLGDVSVTSGEQGPRTGDGSLAGSTLTMDEAVRNLVNWAGAGPREAVACASVNPASVIHGAGDDEDRVILGPELQVKSTYVGGELAYISS